MLKPLVFLLLINAPDGGQAIAYQPKPMTFEACDRMQRAIWAQDWEIVAHDEAGYAVAAVDAACVGRNDPSL